MGSAQGAVFSGDAPVWVLKSFVSGETISKDSSPSHCLHHFPFRCTLLFGFPVQGYCGFYSAKKNLFWNLFYLLPLLGFLCFCTSLFLQGHWDLGTLGISLLVFSLYLKQEPSRILASFRKILQPAILSLVLSLLVLEIVLRLFLGNLRIVHTADNLPDGRCAGLAPNTTWVYTGWLLKIPPARHDVNVFGYRGTPRPQTKPTGTFRIALMGDSLTYGQGVESNQTMAYYLEEILKKRMRKSVEVLNFGVPGYNLKDNVDQFRLFASKWHPDLVLLVLVDNDLDASICRHVKDSVLLGLSVMYIYTVRLGYFLYRFPADFVFHQKKNPAQLKIELVRLKNACKREKTAMAVIIMGDPLEGQRYLMQGKHKGKLRTTLGQFGILSFDPNARTLRTIPKEGHLSKEGNYEAAERIGSWLLKQVLVK